MDLGLFGAHCSQTKPSLRIGTFQPSGIQVPSCFSTPGPRLPFAHPAFSLSGPACSSRPAPHFCITSPRLLLLPGIPSPANSTTPQHWIPPIPQGSALKTPPPGSLPPFSACTPAPSPPPSPGGLWPTLHRNRSSLKKACPTPRLFSHSPSPFSDAERKAFKVIPNDQTHRDQKHKPAPSQQWDTHKSRRCSAPDTPAWTNATVQRTRQHMRAGGISGGFLC